MLAEATELNLLSYYMCFLQLTWAGIPALIVHGNSLSLETFEAAYTPPSIIFLEYHGHLFEKKDAVEIPEETIPTPIETLRTEIKEEVIPVPVMNETLKTLQVEGMPEEMIQPQIATH